MKRREFIKLVCTGVLASPLPASAQKRTNAVIGMLTAVTPNAVQLATIRKGLDERGYVEGRNLTVLYRSAEGKFDRLPALAADLVGNHVALILAYGSPVPARSAKAATATIPIVFAYGGDPSLTVLSPASTGPAEMSLARPSSAQRFQEKSWSCCGNWCLK